MTKIAFTGDFAFTKYFAPYVRSDDVISQEIRDYLCDSDHTVVNVEGAVQTAETNEIGTFVHANPKDIVYQTKQINGTIWSIANNQIEDCGIDGIEGTARYARENGATPIGAGENKEKVATPVIIDGDGGIGIFSVTYYGKKRAAEDNKPGCVMWDDNETIQKTINEIKSKCRWCVIVPHAGVEFAQLPMPHVREQYIKYLEMGADMVVGHHSHVVQSYERVGSKIIFYSLGNFVFDTDYQRAQKYTENGMLVKISFTPDSYTWDYMPVYIDREKHQVVKGECPVIFRHFSPKEYKLMWPRAAQNYTINNRRIALHLYEETRSYSMLDWVTKREWKNYKTKNGKQATHGRILSLLQLWRLGDKDVIEYLKNDGWKNTPPKP
ncbi:MAG: CapA family protein [Clostridia bacterium]|nr:CapA family protein [Clostridia bacterium]